MVERKEGQDGWAAETSEKNFEVTGMMSNSRRHTEQLQEGKGGRERVRAHVRLQSRRRDRRIVEEWAAAAAEVTVVA